LPWLFAVTMFVSATLLFLIQPMIAKMILPLLGGTPAVWNTCMVFFQAALLAGYAYAHAMTTWLGTRRQVLLHTVLIFLPLVVLPIGLVSGWVPPDNSNPIPWLLGLLTVSIGLPFFVLSSSAPLLQKWFANTDHPSAKDPYFLYAASNLGSMLALLSYPTLVEPWLPLKALHWFSQSYLWAFGYVLLVILLLYCARVVWRAQPKAGVAPPKRLASSSKSAITEVEALAPTTWQCLHWIGLALVPSSLMLGVTTFITLDIAAVPLFWVIPLALYLLSFIIVFAWWPPIMHKIMILAMPLVVLLLVFATTAEVRLSIGPKILLHLLAFFMVAMVCHGELAKTRPAPRYLTMFYLFMSLGGVLGGLFNALIAPLVFSTVLEYQLAIVFGCLLLPSVVPGGKTWISQFFPDSLAVPVSIALDVVLAVVLGVAALTIIQFLAGPGLNAPWSAEAQKWARQRLEWVCTRDGKFDNDMYGRLESVIMFGLPTLLCYAYVVRPLRFGLSVAALLLVGAIWDASKHSTSEVVHQERSFFGVLRVEHSTYNTIFDVYTLLHGTTLHGEQIRSPDLQDQPLTYYYKTGPIGQAFASFQGKYAKKNIALIGLGTGTMACYSEPGRQLTFYDIDPAVVRIAQNPKYFTYWQDCRPTPDLILGDARLKLEHAANKQYDVILLDAFSSDAIPIHLITREAIELYFRKLTDNGVLMVHISNRYLDLEPVLGNLAENLDLFTLLLSDEIGEDEGGGAGKRPSKWVILARRREDLGELREAPRGTHGWRQAKTNPKVGIWTDDFSNVLRVMDW